MRVLYIDVDSLRPDHLGCYGYHRNTSPNIDELAESGRRYTNYYVSDAPCLPSRTALFTGRFGIHTGVNNHGGTNAQPRRHGLARGFANHGVRRTWLEALQHADMDTVMISSFPARHGAHHVVDGATTWIDPGGNGGDRAHEVYPLAESWLDDHAAEDDWFLHVNFWDPHTRYDTPESFGYPFEEVPAPEWPDEATIQEHYESYGPHSAQDVHGWGDDPDLPRTPAEIDSREEFKQWIDGYDVGVRYMDEYVGKLLDDLKAAGVYEDTLVILSADHGENQGELNVYGDHQTADEKTCNVPLVVSGPDVEPGVDDGLYYQVDLAPTVTDLADGNMSPKWDGKSFADNLTDGTDQGRDYLVLSQGAWACQRAVRWDDWLYVETYHDGLKDFPRHMLFDVAADPHETTNLAPDRDAVVREGRSLMKEWHDERMLETARGENGGIKGIEDGLVDPLWSIIDEGGPHHATGKVEEYVERLEATDREEHAEKLRSQYD